MAKPVNLTDRELDIMTVLWDNGSSTVAEVRARLDDDVTHNTVQKLLSILEDKGHVRHEEVGKAHRFHAVTKREAASSSAVRRVVDRLFGGSEAMLVAHLASGGRMDRAEVEELRQTLDRLLEQGEQEQRAGTQGESRRKRVP
jgi:BlaI family transcriptional regulator, penicillinase repressor